MTELDTVLERAKELGFFGPSEISDQIAHALEFLPLFDSFESEPIRVIDLGAGGGLPSLPLLVNSTRLAISMLDTSERRCSFLTWAVSELGLSERAEVLHKRAEEFASEGSNRETYDAVIARGFGPPAATIESGAPLLRVGGKLMISEPPEQREWPSSPLAQVGLRFIETGKVAIFEKVAVCDPTYPRSWKHIKSKPLFDL